MLVSLGGRPTWQLHTGLCKRCKIFRQIFEDRENAQTWNLEKCLRLGLNQRRFFRIRRRFRIHQFSNIRIRWRLHLKDIRIPNRLHRTTTPGTFTIKWLTSSLLPRQRETICHQKCLLVGWDSLKFSFHSLLLVIMLSHQVFVLVSSRIIQIMFSIVPSSFSIKCGGRQQCLRRFGLLDPPFFFFLPHT